MIFWLYFLGTLNTVAAVTEGCVLPNPKEPFQTCNMVDYPFYMPDTSKSIHLLDHQANLAFQSFADNFYSDTSDWIQTEDCANAMRGFQCSLVFQRCDDTNPSNPTPLMPCQSTCNSFADLCYIPTYASNFKKSTCQYWPADDCTKIVLPSPPPPPISAHGVLANETVRISLVGEVNFGAENLQVKDTTMVFNLRGANNTLTATLKDATFDMGVGYWFKQYSFPWVSDQGRVRASTTEDMQLQMSLSYNSRTRQWDGEVESVSIGLNVEFFDTSLGWLKNWLVSWWQGWVDSAIATAITDELVDAIKAALTFEMGLYVEAHQQATLDMDFSIRFSDPGASRR